MGLFIKDNFVPSKEGTPRHLVCFNPEYALCSFFIKRTFIGAKIHIKVILKGWISFI